MMVDLATCEWNPGSNRSIVSIEVAAKRVRIEDRFLLIKAFNARLYNDQVAITKDSIAGTAQYSAVIQNMNFGTGRLCKVVTRKKWTQKAVVSAIVFWINGRAYGYASACGNLFELSLEPSKITLQEPVESTEQTFTNPTEIGQPYGPLYYYPNGGYLQPQSEVPATETPGDSFRSNCSCEFTGVGYGGGGYFGGGSGTIPNIPGGHYPPQPITPIPELPIWAYLGFGPFILGVTRWMTQRRKSNQ